MRISTDDSVSVESCGITEGTKIHVQDQQALN